MCDGRTLGRRCLNRPGETKRNDDSRSDEPSPTKNGKFQSADSIEIPPICLFAKVYYTDAANLEILSQLLLNEYALVKIPLIKRPVNRHEECTKNVYLGLELNFIYIPLSLYNFFISYISSRIFCLFAILSLTRKRLAALFAIDIIPT